MQYLEDFLTASDGHEIPIRLWRPRTVDNILVIAHGMAEYCERYTRFADWLTESNIAVIALNHRGHGMDCPIEDLGYFAPERGWQKLIDDLNQTVEYIRKELPKTPITLLGHSMGSFLSQCYIQQYGQNIHQVILMSTNRINRPKVTGALLLTSLIRMAKGPTAVSPFIENQSLGRFNRVFQPTGSDTDWLNRNNEQVAAYNDDPYCGFLCTTQMWRDFFRGMLSIDYAKWPKNLPVYLMAGTHDGVGEMGKGIEILDKKLKLFGCNLVETKLYPEARHELIHELNAAEVWQDVKAAILRATL